MQNPEVNVALDEGAYVPVRAHETDAGADIRTPKPFVVEGGGSATVHTGLHVETPAGHVTLIKSKSGINIHGGVVCEGVVDEGYSGEIVVKLYNHSDRSVTFERGDKIAQMLIVPVVYPSFVEVPEVRGGDRGANGFGSTGR